MAYELWRNTLNEGFFISLNLVEYYAPPLSVFQIPEEYHNVIIRRGYAVEFVTVMDTDVMYMGDMLTVDIEGKDRPIEATIATAEAFLKKPSKAKKKPN